MATIAKTVVATGCSSGIGFEVVKQLLEQAQPHRFIIGARDPTKVQKEFDALKYDESKHSISLLQLELSNMKNVKSFAGEALEKVGRNKLDVLFLNAGMNKGAEEPGPNGSKWSEQFLTNALSQHYLTHLLKDKLVESHSRVVVVSSGAVRMVKDQEHVARLDKEVLGASGTPGGELYADSKFVQLLNAHWWRRQLTGTNDVVAVSPGLIPNTNLGRHGNFKANMSNPDAKDVPTGARSLLAAWNRDDFPKDPDQIFLTSWGEWWPKTVYELTLDKKLQDKWSPSKETIEQEEGLL